MILQVETLEAIENLEAIAGTDGVDAIFVGPADLAASMGYPGEPNNRIVVEQVEMVVDRLQKMNVPSGILTADKNFAQKCLKCGVSFVAAGVDSALLMKALKDTKNSIEY